MFAKDASVIGRDIQKKAAILILERKGREKGPLQNVRGTNNYLASRTFDKTCRELLIPEFTPEQNIRFPSF